MLERETWVMWLDKHQQAEESILNTSKVYLKKLHKHSGADNLASKHDRLNLKGSAELGEEND